MIEGVIGILLIEDNKDDAELTLLGYHWLVLNRKSF
jgi:hypothetical protein